jgi:hypothetical protein
VHDPCECKIVLKLGQVFNSVFNLNCSRPPNGIQHDHVEGACGHRTPARADLRALASDLHAAFGGMRSTAPCGDGVNALWHRRHRCPSDAADACLGPALCPFRSARVLGDGGSLRCGVAPRSDAARAFWQTNLIFRFSPLAKPAASRCVLICAG